MFKLTVIFRTRSNLIKGLYRKVFVDSFEVTMEEGKIILKPVRNQKRSKRSFASVKGILNGEFEKTYGKSPTEVIRESRNED